MGKLTEDLQQLSPLQRAVLALKEAKGQLDAMKRAQAEPIAIIGIGCRFPGGANDPDSYWQLLRNGTDAIAEVPADRWDIDALYDPDPDHPGKVSSRFGAFLQSVDRFDAHFFGISPREAVTMDPQQRLILEVAWEALEQAGLAAEKISGSKTGVFVGVTASDYSQLVRRGGLEKIDAYYLTGNCLNVIPGRLAFLLGLHGPSFAVDTACSSSLTAVHLACQSLRGGECQMALAGGVNVILSLETNVSASRAHMLAKDGRCKTFDAAADGFVRGEGCGVVVLKRLSDARANGDRILALIRGSAINQDGASSGLTVPNSEAQKALIHEALKNAHIEPHEVQYVEAHGTGTSLGDPIEVRALGEVLCQGRSREQALLIGSVKTNFGHLESAAGIAGLIKVALALNHREIPPHLHFREINPDIPLKDLSVTIPTEPTEWPKWSGRHVAGVSAFGVSGTNVHVILEEAPVGASENGRADELANESGMSTTPPSTLGKDRTAHLLAFSAKDANALKETAGRYASHLSSNTAQTLPDVCYSASVGRSHFTHRLAITAGSAEQTIERLSAFVAGREEAGIATSVVKSSQQPKVAFLYAGQGYQHAGMGRILYDTQPTFRQAMDKCAELFRPYLDTSLLSILYPDLDGGTGNASLIDQTFYTQPAMFSLQYALTQLWLSWGLKPAVVMGHSLGEFMAAHVAGIYRLEDAVKLVAERGRITHDVPQVGMMASVQASEEQVTAEIAHHDGKICIAAINGPDSIVISGIKDNVNELLAKFESEGINIRRLAISNAFHSPFIEPALDTYERRASEVEYQVPHLRLISTLTGKLLPQDQAPDAHYWRRHLREPVQFYAAMRTLHELGYDLFLELGPNPTLLGMGSRCLPEVTASWFPSLRQGRDDWQQILDSLGGLYARGVEIDWQGYDRDYQRSRVSLPTYPFQRKRYWVEEHDATSADRGAKGAARKVGIHPLLDTCTRSPLVKEIIFESELGLRFLPYLEDHRVHGAVVFPLTGHLETILAAGRSAFNSSELVLQDIVVREPLVLDEEKARPIQVVITPDENNCASVQLISLPSEIEDQQTEHRIHVTGKIVLLGSNGEQKPVLSPETLRARCDEEIPTDGYYHELWERGLQFGPRFQGIAKLWRGQGEALAQTQTPEELQQDLDKYHMHPATLDACLQAFVVASDCPNHETYLPLSLESYRLYKRPSEILWSSVQIHDDVRNDEAYSGDVLIYDTQGELVAELKGLLMKRTGAETLHADAQGDISEWLYEVAWLPKPLPAADIEKHFGPWASPARLAQIAGARLPHLRAGSDLAAYETVLPKLDELCAAYIVQALRQLGFGMQIRQRFSTDVLIHKLGVVEKQRRLFHRLLDVLAEDGILQPVDVGWEVCNLPEIDKPEVYCKALLDQYPACNVELTLLGLCGLYLAQVLCGNHDPLQLLFPGGSVELLEKLYQRSPMTQAMNRLVEEAMVTATSHFPKDRKLRVLEIGAGTGGTTTFVLPKLPADRTEYVFTDVSPLFLHKAQQKFSKYPFVRCQALDIERDPKVQGFEEHGYDVVIATNALHATSDLRAAVGHAAKLLASEGLLILVEGAAPERWVDLTFGMTEGWWKFTDAELRPFYPLISKDQWTSLLQELGFSESRVVPSLEENEASGRALAQHALILSRAPRVQPTPQRLAETDASSQATWLIFADQGGVGEDLALLLQGRGDQPVLVSPGDQFGQESKHHFVVDPRQPEHFRQLFGSTLSGGKACRGVVHLWNLDLQSHGDLSLPDLHDDEMYGTASVLHLTQAMIREASSESPRLWLVTRGAQQVGRINTPVEVTQAPTWGLRKVISLEHPELQCTAVDLEHGNEAHALVNEICNDEAEDQIVYRNGERFVARLVHANDGEALIARSEKRNAEVSEIAKPEDELPTPVQLTIAKPGILDGLEYHAQERRAPEAGEVEIRVRAAGLNFRDVLNVLGMYPGDAGPLGGECSGTVVSLGEGIDEFQVGDEVMAIAPGSFSTFVTIHSDLVVKKPESLSFEQAATIPSAFLTAHYTLIELGKLSAGENVLIHSATGGVGLAAVQLAMRVGAKIFATAGNDEKREYLRSLGIRYVMDSRSLGFARELMTFTDEAGMDVVLNSLSGEFIPTSLSVLKDEGRFVEIGKREVWSREQVDQFKRIGEYHVVDLAATTHENPALIKAVLSEVKAGIEDGSLQPLPMRVFIGSDAVEAFRCMQQAKHIGKIVVSIKGDEREARSEERKAKSEEGEAKSEEREANTTDLSRATRYALRPDATYLITGGLAGLGLLTAKWMVERGARHLALMGRSGASEAALASIVEMENAGAQVLALQGDVTCETDVIAALNRIDATMPPLRGIVHSVGVLDDGALLQQTWERFAKVLAPKVDGSWLLHQLTSELELDFFVLYSSMTSMIGQRGQGNHASANAFLDALAHHRRTQGLPAVSIHWGAWSEVGSAAARQVGERVSAQGLGTISPQKGLQVLERIMLEAPAEIGVLPVNWRSYAQQFGEKVPTFISELVKFTSPVESKKPAAPAQQSPKILEQLASAPAPKRRNILSDYVKAQAIRVLALDSSHPIDREQPLQTLGLDSLMAVELRNLIGAGLGLKRALPATLLFDYPTIAAVADYLAREVLELDSNGQKEESKASPQNGKQAALDEMQSLSDEEAEALLLKELEGV